MKTIKTSLILAAAAVLVLAFGGCTDEASDPLSPAVDGSDRDAKAEVTIEDGYTRYDGVMGGGNLYAFLVPDDWNGELVLYAHGFVDADEPVELPTKDNVVEIRDRMVELGFAWAYCSYRENGLAVKDGAWATRALQNLFVAVVKDSPTSTWLFGQSLGGLIAVELAETHPNDYDGVLTLGGMIGGTRAQLGYVGDVRILFDFFYSGVLPGTVIDVPEGLDLEQDVILPVIGAVQADPTGLGVISMLAQTPLPGTNGEQFVESLVTAIGFNVRGIHDILERTNGRCPIDNQQTVYEAAVPGTLPPELLALINAGVQRYDRPLAIENLFDRHYEPTGELTVPMVAWHNRHDPIVPNFHESIYAQRVAAAGNAANLAQTTTERYGHTDFSGDEAAAALMELRAMATDDLKLALAHESH